MGASNGGGPVVLEIGVADAVPWNTRRAIWGGADSTFVNVVI